MKTIRITIFTLFSIALTVSAESSQPNVLLFVLDDMNDWIGAMGYEQAVTPNIDRLAAEGVNFRNAHTAGVFCAPSRSAFFLGRHATTTGCYTGQVYFYEHPDVAPLQMIFQQGGYRTYGGGKLFHHPAGYVDLRAWDEFFVRDEAQKTRGWPLDSWTVDDPILPQPYPNSRFNHDRKPANKFFLEWGKVLDVNEEKMADTLRVNWACDILRKRHDKPVFLGVGLYTPHFPNYAPAKYFDLYDPEKIELPAYKADDLDDLPPAVRKAKQRRGAIHRRLEELDAVADAIHGYLACVSYADAMLGRLRAAIESGPNADNTIVVLWSDHGYHHGEKFDWGKHTLWERTSNVPFIWTGPGIKKGATVDTTVSLIDTFPTLTELCDLPDEHSRDGVSLAPILTNPSLAKDRDILLPGMKPGEYAMINRDWRYIRYADDTEELYNTRHDPNEWENLADNPEFAGVKEQLWAAAPTSFAEPGKEPKELTLLIDGEGFEWRPKQKKKPKTLPGSVRGIRMTPRKSNEEAQMEPVKIDGRSAWKSRLRDDKPTYFYFKLTDPSFRNGKQPAVQLTITYLDRGNTGVIVQYDSGDEKVNEAPSSGTGAFKKATRFQVRDSSKWKTVIIDLKDAHFAARCNGGDLRINFTNPKVDPVIAEVLVKPIR